MGMARLKCLEQGFRPSEASCRRIAKRQSKYNCWMDHSALLSVSVVILITFMLNPHVAESGHGVSVDLAKSRHASRLSGALCEDALRLVVTRDGNLYFGSERIDSGDLPDQIRRGVRAGAEDRVYLLVDSRIKYADVKPVLNEIGLAGVKNISFVTRPVPRQNPDSQNVAPAPSQSKGVSEGSKQLRPVRPRKFSLAFPHTPDVL
jgi:biopolymer transport protein ExbD